MFLNISIMYRSENWNSAMNCIVDLNTLTMMSNAHKKRCGCARPERFEPRKHQ